MDAVARDYVEIPLTQGKTALIDKVDVSLVAPHKWFACKYQCTYYAKRNVWTNGRGTTVFMHRTILDAKKGENTDHINGDGLDNRRSNIRVCTSAENARNKHSRRGKSKYKGVSWFKRDKKWVTHIKANGKSINLGYSFNEIDAAKTYDKAAIKYFGEFANTNYLYALGGKRE